MASDGRPVSACNAEYDVDHLSHILETAANLPFLSAIILVANGSVARETMNIRNVFTLLRGNMPDAVLDNTLAVFTNCNSLTSCACPLLCKTAKQVDRACANKKAALCPCRNLDPKVLPMRLSKEHLFYTDNSVFSTDPNRLDGCSLC